MSSILDAVLKLSKMTSSQKLFEYDSITLYQPYPALSVRLPRHLFSGTEDSSGFLNIEWAEFVHIVLLKGNIRLERTSKKSNLRSVEG